MIKVKAALNRQADTGPTRAHFVEAGVEKTPAGLATVGMLLVSVALYFKGIVAPYGSTRLPEEGPRAPQEEDKAAMAPEDDERLAVAETQEQPEAEAEVVNLDAKRFTRSKGSSSFSPDFAAPPIDVEDIEAPALKSMAQRQPSDDVDLLEPRINQLRDLASTLGGSGGGAGGGGGSGGGGGESSAPQSPIGNGNGTPQRNRAPVVAGPVSLRSVAAGETIFIAFGALLAGAVDPDNDVLRILGLRASAGELVATEGGWLYTAPNEMLGPVRLSYLISDGSDAVRQTAGFDVTERGPILGTEGDDSLVGTPQDDRIDGLGGNDTIRALSGHDVVQGGEGNDLITAAGGNDTVFGGAGDDTIDAGDGDDIVWAGQGNDVVYGGAGNDMLFGEDGNDRMGGGLGNDVMWGGLGNDSLAGDAGNDALLGEDGNDSLDGGEGNDFLADGRGSDVVKGGAGNDVVEVAMDGEADTMDGGAGRDTLDLAAASGALRIDLQAGQVEGQETGQDTVTGFERVVSGRGDDTLVMALNGSADTLDGGAGQDLLDIAAAQSSVTVDLVEGSASGEEIGEDVIASFEIVRTGEGDDTVVVGLQAVDVGTGGGDDTVVASANRQSDSLDGGEGSDTLDLSAATLAVIVDLVEGTLSGEETGNDRISSFETVKLGGGDDEVRVGDAPTVLCGGEGDDTFEFRAASAPPQNAPSSDPSATPTDATAPLIHQILDFAVGDRIRIGSFIIERDDGEISGSMRDGDQQVRFELKPVNPDAGLESGQPFRLRIEERDGAERTVIDVVVDGLDDPDYSIALTGLQHLTYTLAQH